MGSFRNRDNRLAKLLSLAPSGQVSPGRRMPPAMLSDYHALLAVLSDR
jgi:hypothetical protein